MDNCDIRFSPREQEVLNLISQCQNYENISSHLRISRRTLHKHVEHISKKLKLSSKVGGRVQQDIAKYAIEHGYGKEQHVAS